MKTRINRKGVTSSGELLDDSLQIDHLGSELSASFLRRQTALLVAPA